MKYAILADIHANLEALDAVLADAQENGANEIIIAGDLVGYNADPKPCLKRIKSIKGIVVQGNHDANIASMDSFNQMNPVARQTLLWTRKQLSFWDRNYLKKLPLIADTEHFTVVHSSLNHPEKWNYIRDIKSAEKHFKNQFSTLCFYGHTHLPTVFIKDETIQQQSLNTFTLSPNKQYLINGGSVGQPRDLNPLAAYVLYDSEQQTVTPRRVPYNIQQAQQKIARAKLPEHTADRLAIGQ